ncbi:thiamine phosphate synthase, partial [Xanthomonas sacchari]|uniref:thiamine phosphate synthase n=1 Tax=Xanthomonas sacchari TaxID=56458 RepID=UPI003D2F9798
MSAAQWAPRARTAGTGGAKRGAKVLLNRGVARAQEVGVGVHLGAEQLPQWQARPLPAGQAVAASGHTVEELQAAQRIGCAFAVVGPLAPTA